MPTNISLKPANGVEPAPRSGAGARFTLVLALLVLMAGTANAQTYEFHDLPVTGGVLWSAGISNSRVTVGWTADPLDDRVRTGWISTLEGYELYDHPGAEITTLSGINESGAISGYIYDETGNHGLILHPNGESTVVDFPGFEGSTVGWAINNRGAMVGFYCNNLLPLCGQASTRSFLRSGRGEFTEIDFPGSFVTIALAINDANEVAGLHFDGSGLRGFVWSQDSGYESFDVPGAVTTQAHGINNRGDVVGIYADENNVRHGFLRTRDGDFKTLDVPNSRLTEAREINDRGDVTGAYRDADSGERRVFLARRIGGRTAGARLSFGAQN